MAKDILFRGIDAYRKIWLYGFLSWKDYNKKHFIINNLSVLASTVGQYTGLTDIDGKRIFEGTLWSSMTTAMLWSGTIMTATTY